jgi:hypothetical protein
LWRECGIGFQSRPENFDCCLQHNFLSAQFAPFAGVIVQRVLEGK